MRVQTPRNRYVSLVLSATTGASPILTASCSSDMHALQKSQSNEASLLGIEELGYSLLRDMERGAPEEHLPLAATLVEKLFEAELGADLPSFVVQSTTGPQVSASTVAAGLEMHQLQAEYDQVQCNLAHYIQIMPDGSKTFRQNLSDGERQTAEGLRLELWRIYREMQRIQADPQVMQELSNLGSTLQKVGTKQNSMSQSHEKTQTGSIVNRPKIAEARVELELAQKISNRIEKVERMTASTHQQNKIGSIQALRVLPKPEPRPTPKKPLPPVEPLFPPGGPDSCEQNNTLPPLIFWIPGAGGSGSNEIMVYDPQAIHSEIPVTPSEYRPFQPEVPAVPGPLPVMGIAALWGWAIKLKKEVKRREHLLAKAKENLRAP